MQKLHHHRMRPIPPLLGTGLQNHEQSLTSPTWNLSQHQTATLHRTSVPNIPWATSICIEKSVPSSSTSFQIEWFPIGIEANRRYTASCWIRSVTPRLVRLEIAQDHDHAANRVSTQVYPLAQEWEHLAVDFSPKSDQTAAVVRLDLGDQFSPVELSDLRFGSPLFELYRLDCRLGSTARVVPLIEDTRGVRIAIDELLVLANLLPFK